MSSYGWYILITLLITSFIAFYMLYKAKELNLGMIISISAGTIILGVLFSPVFKFILSFLSQNLNFNKQIALIISLIIILIIFLIFILIFSLIVTLCIPKRWIQVDCGKYIDRFIGLIKGIKIKQFIIEKCQHCTKSIGVIISKMSNVTNMLKKPVDTSEIIDKMGIEKNDNYSECVACDETVHIDISEFGEEISENEEVLDNTVTENEQTLDDYLEIEQQSEDIVSFDFQPISDSDNSTPVQSDDFAEYEGESDIPEDQVKIEVSVLPESEPTNEPELSDINESVQEPVFIGETEISELQKPEQEEKELLELFEESEVLEKPAEPIESEYPELPENQEPDYAELITQDSLTVEIDNSQDAEQYAIEQDYSQPKKPENADELVLRAFECKDSGNREEAINYYMMALQASPKDEMIFWIVLDICSLYKQLGLSDLAKIILEGIIKQFGSAIQPDIRQEIMNNLQ